jgi:hypothetical protein
LYQACGNKPFFFYAVFGPDFSGLRVSEERHRAAGIPSGIRFLLHDIRKDSETMTLFYSNRLGELLREKGDDVFRRVALSPACLVIVGEVQEDDTLEYMRSMIGIVQAALELNAAAVLDTQSLRWYTPREWSDAQFEVTQFLPLEQTALLVTAESKGDTEANSGSGSSTFRLHTRGMRKFGRPDVSVRNVPEAEIPVVTSLVNRLIELQAAGQALQAVSTVEWRGKEWTLAGAYDANADNPDFNNESVEYEYRLDWSAED